MLMAGLKQDVRFGLRTLARNRGFAIAAIVTLSLGIGVNTLPSQRGLFTTLQPKRQLISTIHSDACFTSSDSMNHEELEDREEMNFGSVERKRRRFTLRSKRSGPGTVPAALNLLHLRIDKRSGQIENPSSVPHSSFGGEQCPDLF